MRPPEPSQSDATRTAQPVAGTLTYPGVGAADTRTRTRDPDPAADTRPAAFADSSTPINPPGFVVLGKLGEGGMGTVLHAREVAFGREVAIKVLKLNVFDEQAARERFAREARAMARIEHPNLVPVYQSGEHNGVPYFAMKYMRGGTLAGVKGRVGANRAAELLRDIARGVAALHAAGVLHRDLKPSNVLLDESGVPHVADFGLVKWLDDDEHTQTGLRNGTPPYMSPEQVAGRSRKLTPACDTWALCVIGYELVCGRRPFDQEDREELYEAIRTQQPPDPFSLVADLPPPLGTILLAGLHKDPAKRYATAAELADDLDRYLAKQSVRAVVPTTVSEPTAPKRRTVLKVAAGVGGLGLLGGAGAVLASLFGKPKPPPDPPPQPTFSETVLAALARGETVDLIGENGLPKWHTVYPEGAVLLTADPAGGVRVSRNQNQDRPFPIAYLELFADAIPCGYRLDVELAYLSKPESVTTVGVYAGRRSWAMPNGDWQTAVTARQVPTKGGKFAPPDLYYLDIILDPPPRKWRGENLNINLSAYNRPAPPAPVKGQASLSFALAVTAAGFAFVAPTDLIDVGKKPPVLMTIASVRQAFADRDAAKSLLTPPNQPQEQVPAFAQADPLGTGLGVYLRAADVLVRSARLSPL